MVFKWNIICKLCVTISKLTNKWISNQSRKLQSFIMLELIQNLNILLKKEKLGLKKVFFTIVYRPVKNAVIFIEDFTNAFTCRAISFF